MQFMQHKINMDDQLIESQLISIITVSSSFLIKEEDSNFLSSSSDDESELSDEEETDISTLYAILMTGNTRGVNIPQHKLTDYVERVVPGYSRQQFKEHFR